MTKLVVIETPELEKLGNEKSQQIRKTFAPMADMVEAIEDDFKAIMSIPKDEIDQDVCDKAKRLRLSIVKIRTKTAANHKEQKAEYLMAGRAIDGIKNILTWAVEPKEKSLKEIENHFLNIENERLDKIKTDRENWLVKDTDIDPKTCGIDLRNMDKDVWAAYAQSKKQERADRIQAEEEAEKARIQAEKDRIAEQERVKAENERLRLEAEEREKKAEADKVERERIAKIESDRLAKIESDRVKSEEKRVADQAKKDSKIKADADAKVKAAEKKAEDDRIEVARLAKVESDKAKEVQKKKDALKAKEDAKIKAENDKKQAEIQADLDAAQAKEKARVESEEAEDERIEQEKEALKKAGDKGAMKQIRVSIADVMETIDATKFKSKASKETMKAVKNLLDQAWTKL